MLVLKSLAIAQLAHQRHAEELFHVHFVDVSFEHFVNDVENSDLIWIGTLQVGYLFGKQQILTQVSLELKLEDERVNLALSFEK